MPASNSKGSNLPSSGNQSGIPLQTKELSGSRSLLAVDYAAWKKGPPARDTITRGRPSRLVLLVVVALLWVGALTWRMYSLQVADVETWQDWAVRQHVAEVQVASERGPILDRNGKLLAVSVPAGSVYVRPKQIGAPDTPSFNSAVRELSKLLEMKPAIVATKLRSKQPFVWLKRQIPRFKTDEVMARTISGVGVVMESRRFYPYNQSASALVGKVGVDGAGLSGVEALYEKKLHVEHSTTKVSKDAFGKIIQVSGSDTEAPFAVPKGDALRLTIDADLQIIMDEELDAGRKAANAKQAMAVMIDSETGEVVALSQSPSFNFNVPSENSKKALSNLLVEAVFEPGSVMKPLVTAAAIDAGVVTPSELINCENGRFSYGSHTIKDVHPSGVISVFDVVVRSSNIGMTKIGMRMGSDRLYSYLRRFGFGSASDLGLAGESGGILRPVSRWSKVDVATHSFGQGVAVTPLQVVRAVAVIANGGILPKLSVVVDESGIPAGERIISDKAAGYVKEMMYGVTEDKHGTGSKALIPGFRVGGKTGTAQKASPNGRGYAPGLYVASFVGFVDGSSMGIPRNLTTMVIMDEPHAGTIYGGTLAAPVFQKIMERSYKYMGTRNDLNGGGQRSPRYIEPRDSFGVKDDELFPASYRR